MGTQLVANLGLYFVAYRLSQRGWNVMPTARNARGIDLLAYDASASRYLGIQVKALSKQGAVPLGTKGVDNLLGDWWIILNKVQSTTPECFIIRPTEVSKLAVRDAGGERAYWLPAKQYQTDEFREAWHRIGSGDVGGTPPPMTAYEKALRDIKGLQEFLRLNGLEIARAATPAERQTLIDNSTWLMQEINKLIGDLRSSQTYLKFEHHPIWASFCVG